MSNPYFAGPFQVQPSTVQVQGLATPTAPNSTSAFQTQAYNVLFTPNSSGRVFAQFSATVAASQTTAGNGLIIEMFYAPVQSGVALPSVNSALPSSAVVFTGISKYGAGTTLTANTDGFEPISIQGVAIGLTLGQQYYFDIAAEAFTNASDNTLVSGSFTIIEL